MSTHDRETLAIEIVAKRLRSLPELVQVALESSDPKATKLFHEILNDMKGRLK